MKADIYNNKESITRVTENEVRYIFPDGTQGSTRINADDILTLRTLKDWFDAEIGFYNRMYKELMKSWEAKKSRLTEKSSTPDTAAVNAINAEANEIVEKMHRLHEISKQIEEVINR